MRSTFFNSNGAPGAILFARRCARLRNDGSALLIVKSSIKAKALHFSSKLF